MATVDFNFAPASTPQRSLGVDQLDQSVDSLPLSACQYDVLESEVGDDQQSTVKLHRIRTVRMQQEVSMRTAARRSGVDVRTLRRQEQENTDLSLSDLHKWQEALDVPIAELVEEPGAHLSKSVMERAKMVRLMKTATSIQEKSQTDSLSRLAQVMVDQLVDMMPELEGVSAWHEFGQRRSLDEYGRAAERSLSYDSLIQSCRD
ncbi:MAG: helix-turn-helix transcriptional regulator [Pirellulaceae bacterium]|nr:helix-turn-helix transcriptional regulator [Pirellulaceae bacterium]